MMIRFLAAAAVLSMLILPGCTERTQQQQSATTAVNFTLQDLNGKTVTLDEHKGKVVLLDFWATWCPPCRASVPAIERLHRNYSDKGLVVLAISLDYGDWDHVRSFKKGYDISYTILRGNDEVADQYMVRVIPLLVLIDREGTVRRRMTGSGIEEMIEKEVQALLAPDAARASH